MTRSPTRPAANAEPATAAGGRPAGADDGVEDGPRRPGRPRIVVVAKGWPPAGGGVERYAEQVATAYADAGFDVHVVAPVRSGTSGPWSTTPIRSRRQAAVALELTARLALAWVRLTVVQVGPVARRGRRGEAGRPGPGETGPGETSPGETGPGETSPGETSPGGASPGEAGPGGTSPGEARPGRVARSWLEGVVAVHATTWRVAVPFVALGWHRRVPLVVTAHGREMLSPTGPARIVRDLVCRRAASLIAVSPFTAAVAGAATGARFETVLNGTSAPPGAGPAAPPAGNRLRLLTVCRLEPRKNVDGILTAMADLRSRPDVGVSVELTVVGDGPERDRLDTRARQLGLDPVVRFTGRVSDEELWDYYRQADVFVHPQVALDGGVDVEGFGLTIADAMAFGLPVIAGRDGGPGTVVPGSGGGLVVDGADSGALAAAISLLAGDADLRRRLGGNGARFAATQLTWQAHVAAVQRQLGLDPGTVAC